MAYSIGTAAKLVDIPPSTIRYYDAQGLLPALGRNAGGLRMFEHADIESLRMIECLKKSGMPIKDICQFMKWCSAGDSSLEERLQMFNERKAAVQQQMDELHRTLDVIEYKCWYYQTALDAGTEQASREMPFDLMPPHIAKLKHEYFPDHPAEDQEGVA